MRSRGRRHVRETIVCMSEEELSLNAWILVGNALHNALEGPAALQVEESPQRLRLQELETTLRNVPAERMGERLAGMPWTDRALLLSLCDAMFERTGDSAAPLLGMDRKEARPVLDILRGER